MRSVAPTRRDRRVRHDGILLIRSTLSCRPIGVCCLPAPGAGAGPGVRLLKNRGDPGDGPPAARDDAAWLGYARRTRRRGPMAFVAPVPRRSEPPAFGSRTARPEP